ncbi:MAG: aspartate dehydrogenase [Gammaproteobacteria bacterium]
MQLGLIGYGAIGRYVHAAATAQGHNVSALLVRPERLQDRPADTGDMRCVDRVADLIVGTDHVIDCAGHAALAAFGPDVLRAGFDLTTVSVGALADPQLFASLDNAARDGTSTLHLASGAIGALDCLRAARAGGLDSVTYVGRKPPKGWRGSPAEQHLDLDALADEPATHFTGCAREAAVRYPKNANVAAAVALAGIGFDATQVELVADPTVSENIHELRASGAFGSFQFEIRGRALPDNPRSSALAAMSVVSKLEQHVARIVI